MEEEAVVFSYATQYFLQNALQHSSGRRYHHDLHLQGLLITVACFFVCQLLQVKWLVLPVRFLSGRCLSFRFDKVWSWI